MDISDLLFMGIGGSVVAVRKSDGATVWSHKLEEGWLEKHAAWFISLVVDGGRVYAHGAGKLFCFDALAGDLLWKVKTERATATLATARSASAEDLLDEQLHAVHGAAAAAGTS
jgi:outer membrane protein assembly factor BamB